MIGGFPVLFNLCSWPDRPVGKAIVAVERGVSKYGVTLIKFYLLWSAMQELNTLSTRIFCSPPFKA